MTKSIKEDTNRLLKITSELLNITQLESGNIKLNIIPTEALEILSYAANTSRSQADQRHIKLEISYSDTPLKVLADKERTVWVLTNIISNAIRYSEEGMSIFLSLTYDEKLKTVSYLVRDTGVGIAPEHQEKIFSRYFRVPDTQKEGTGLGLSISKEFIEAQGGKISVESSLGKGSTFIITLNCAE